MAFPSTNSMNKSPEDDDVEVVEIEVEEDANVDSERGETPLRYVPLCEVYSATSPCVTVAGSKKVKPPNRKHHQMVSHFNGPDHSKPNNNNTNSNHSLSLALPPLRQQLSSAMSPPVTQVYTRRRKRKPSFFDMLIARLNSLNSESFEVKEEEVEVAEIENKLIVNRKKKKEKRKKGKIVNSLKSDGKVHEKCEEEIEDCNVILRKKKEKRKRGRIAISEKSEGEEEEVFEEEEVEDGKPIGKEKKKKKRRMAFDGNSDNSEGKEKDEELEGEGNKKNKKNKKKKKKKKKMGNYELVNLGVSSDTLKDLNGSRLRENRNNYIKSSIQCENSDSKINYRKRKSSDGVENQMQQKNSGSLRTKQWVWLRFDGVDPRKFIGLQCKVYWPLDADWYSGRVIDYNSESGRHQVEYEDGDEEHLILENERVKFYISPEEMQCLKLSCSDRSSDADGLDVNELVVLAASLDDSQEFEPGDIIWAKLTGHAMWPAIVLDDSLVGQRKGLNKASGGKSVLVQFFGTHDFARVKTKQVIPFLRGLLSSFHQKCKRSNFVRSLEEAKIYLSEQRIPKRMLRLHHGLDPDNYDSGNGEDEGIAGSDDECMGNDGKEGRLESSFEIAELKNLSKSKLSSKASKLISLRHQDLPSGYRAVRVKWKDLDKCNVCHMDEEYENNLFLQCDKCRMMVHARCYGELEPVDGVVWLCNLCRPGAPEVPPPCCLCPFIGGAMKPTTDGRWAHLACAMWIPETCLSDIKRMEPIDGLNRINKDRWKLLCSICGVSYGACIQCSNSTCRVAYHPLCARAAGFCVELEDEDRLHLMSFEEDEEDQCIGLLSFCKRHRPLSKDRLVVNERIGQKACENPDYAPPSNPSGCARSEPYNYAGRRGRKEPEALAAASLKRLYVENMPYLVGGNTQHGPLWNTLSADAFTDSKTLVGLRNMRNSHLDASMSILSVAEKYKYMRETFRKRLAFGKSRIHGFGIFAKLPHRAGDMVIEYTGELVRPPVADRREHLIYNSLVGAGTYMFRIDDERVIDATRAGSIAHLINHSCEPNCYSRVLSVNGDKHIIIFAKRDIKQWEELSYDYRFFSIDEQLSCYCGFPRCRGVVNDTEAEERAVKLHAPCGELIDWKGE